MKPDISIVVPFFGRAEQVVNTVHTLVSQSVGNYEVILVDDCSTQADLKIVQREIEKYDRIILLKRDRLPKGANTCRNIGLENAKADLILFFDSDDWMAPWCIKERLQWICEKDDNADFYVFPTLTLPGNGKMVLNMLDEPANLLKGYLGFRSMFNTPAVIWKKNALVRIGVWKEALTCWQDCELYIRAFNQGLACKVAWKAVPDVVVMAEDPDGGGRMSSTFRLDKYKNLLEEGFAPVYRYLEDKGLKKYFYNNSVRIYLDFFENNLSRISMQMIKELLNTRYFKMREIFFIKIYMNGLKSFKQIRLMGIPYRLRAVFYPRLKKQRTAMPEGTFIRFREEMEKMPADVFEQPLTKRIWNRILSESLKNQIIQT